MFKKVLIANRGEIALRVIRACRELGIQTVAVYSEADRESLHVRFADDDVCIGPPPGRDSYLKIPRLIAAAEITGADAIHPGYGFLAENAEFAETCAASNIEFIGPTPSQIRTMGDKASARRAMQDVGVPIIPGSPGPVEDVDEALEFAAKIGFPVIIKASAGGGGKGMRVVRAATELADASSAARREAHRSFGDDRLILERYLEGPRHVEIQVLFDDHGNGIHLGERDCSAQRRNQKILEEAPAPSVTPELRERMGAAALKVASAVGYVSAGTVEMLLTDANEFFFLEMNTRLQVEHPVTEVVTGRDLVEDQLRITGGATLAALGLGTPPPMRGHAIEARLYAEDPEAGFLPATGRLVRIDWPEGVRIDTGVLQGDLVTDRYDPMIAKLIVHGRTRAQAIDRLRTALEHTLILGVRTNLRFLSWLTDQDVFRTGEMRTDTIGTIDLPDSPQLHDEAWAGAAAALVSDDRDPWGGAWRLNGDATIRLAADAEERSTIVRPQPMVIVAVADGGAHVTIELQSIEFRLAPAPTVEAAVRHAAAGAGGGASVLIAPMPGRVIAVHAAEGEPVSAHQAIVIIEAMKMEHAVLAPMDGTLRRLSVGEGQQVQRGDILGDIAPH